MLFPLMGLDLDKAFEFAGDFDQPGIVTDAPRLGRDHGDRQGDQRELLHLPPPVFAADGSCREVILPIMSLAPRVKAGCDFGQGLPHRFNRGDKDKIVSPDVSGKSLGGVGSHRGFDQGIRDFLNNAVPGFIPVGVVIGFEVIDTI